MKKILFLFFVASLMLAACDSSDEPNNGKWTLTKDIDLSLNDIETVDGLNDFSYSMMKEAAAMAEDGDFCVSPLSMSMYLSMFANASNGEIRQEILNALNANDVASLNSLNEKLLHYLPYEENGSALLINNRFWLSNRFKVSSDFKSTVGNVFNAGVESVNFTNSNTVPAINRWISDKTNGMIQSFLDKDWDYYMGCVQISANTVYFKGNWSSRFSERNTVSEVFHGSKGDAEVNMMHQQITANYAQNENFQYVRKDFKGTNVMELYLPAEGITVDQILSLLTPETIDLLRNNEEKYEVTLSLPSFKTSYTLDTNEVMPRLGIGSFLSVDLSPMGITEMSKVEFIHKTSFKIDEDGAELAAVSGSSGLVTSTPDFSEKEVAVEFNRPFVYIIRNQNTNAILMAGVVANP